MPHHPIMWRLKKYAWQCKRYCNYQFRLTWNTNHTKHRCKIELHQIPQVVPTVTITRARLRARGIPVSAQPQRLQRRRRVAPIITTIIIIIIIRPRLVDRDRGQNVTRQTTLSAMRERSIITIKMLAPPHVVRGEVNKEEIRINICCSSKNDWCRK